MALIAQPGNELLEQDSGLGLVWLQNEPDAHHACGTTGP